MKLSDATGTKLTGVPSMWNKISILDKSGEGACASWGEANRGAVHERRWQPATCAARQSVNRPFSSHPRPSTPAGTGFTLQMDTAFLYSSDSFSFSTTAAADPRAPFPCVGKLCSNRPNVTAPQVGLVGLRLQEAAAWLLEGCTHYSAAQPLLLLPALPACRPSWCRCTRATPSACSPPTPRMWTPARPSSCA